MNSWINEMESKGYKYLFKNGESSNPNYWFLTPDKKEVEKYYAGDHTCGSSITVEKALGFYQAYNQGFYDKLQAALKAA